MSDDKPTDNAAISYRGVDAVAAATGLRPFHIRDATQRGFLKPKRIGLATIYLRSEIEEWLAAMPAPHSRRSIREKTDAENSS